MTGPAIRPLAQAHLAGMAAFLSAAALAFIDVRLAALPPAFFLLLCFAAPFFPRAGFYLPVVHRGSRTRRAVSLTFDDGPDPSTTPLLISLLAERGVPAAFFLAGGRAEAHPNLVRLIADAGHEIGNHSYNHDPFLMLKGTNYLRGEIRHAREILARLGIITFAFRPPVGITSPRLWRPLLESGSHCVNFSRRAFDAGNRRLPGMADKLIRRIRPGDIILLHDVAPARGFDRDLWLAEVGRVIDVIREKGLEIAPLSKLTGRRVSVRIGAGDTIPAPSPLDLIATLTGDEGIWGSTYAGKERELFETNLLPLLGPTHRVLDIGTGGAIAISIGRRVESVTAMVPSEGAAALLEEGARREGVDAIDIRTGGLESAERGGHYDAVTCLSSFEYTPVIEHLLAGLSPLLKPGGILYIITARRSCSGFIARARAAMRFGILPRTRSEGSISRALAAAGFRETRITIHHAGSPWASPHLLEVVARKW